MREEEMRKGEEEGGDGGGGSGRGDGGGGRGRWGRSVQATSIVCKLRTFCVGKSDIGWKEEGGREVDGRRGGIPAACVCVGGVWVCVEEDDFAYM